MHSSGIGFGFGLQDADLGLGFGLLYIAGFLGFGFQLRRDCAGARPSKSFNGNGVESFGESTLAVSIYRTGNCRTYRRNGLTPMESGTTVESLHETNCRLYRPQSRRICAHRSHDSGAEPPVWQKCGRERRQIGSRIFEFPLRMLATVRLLGRCPGLTISMRSSSTKTRTVAETK